MTKLEFDSDEEMYFYWWLEELQEAGYIKKIVHHPMPYKLSDPVIGVYEKQLKTKVKNESEELMKGHIYTPDFLIIWNEKARGVFYEHQCSYNRRKEKNSLKYLIGNTATVIEVKPLFDQNNMSRLFKINQKWVYDKHGVFVNMVVPEKWFNKTFTPNRFLTTNKSGKARKIKYKNVISLKDFVGEGKEFEQKELF